SCGDTWLFLPNLVKVRDVGACVVRLWSHVVAPVFRELLVSAGVYRVPAALAGLRIRGGGVTFGGPWRGFGRSSRYSGIRAQGSNEICNELITMAVPKKGSGCELQESVAAVAGCACFRRGCCFARAAFGFVFGLRIRVGVSRRLREPTCGVAFTGAGLCEVLPRFFSSDSGGKLFVVVLVSVVWLVAIALPSRLRCIAWLLCVLEMFSRTVGCCFDEGFSQDCSGLVSVGYCATSGLRLRSGDVFPERLLALWDREVGFVSRTLWALPDGGLVSAMSVWLVVLMWKCQSRLVVVPCVWRRLVVRVSFLCFLVEWQLDLSSVTSRFDPFEVCPGVGIVVTAIVACGVPEWWHSFGYGW
ncbi:hypothetical protein Taro_013534, partial [Colocasia esculenta]|nr:hypothetical protein [Colocasia esculenta]